VFALVLPVSGLLLAQDTSSDSTAFQRLSRQADSEREQGNVDKAVRDYESAVKIRPDWPDGWWYLGTLQADRERYPDAIAAFQKLTAIKPDFGPGWASLGLCEFETKDYGNSLVHLQRAKQLGFADVAALEKPAIYHLALLLNLNGDFENSWEILASRFGQGVLAAQTKTALALALLRIPLLPNQVDPSHDALLEAAGDTAALLVKGSFDLALESFEQMLGTYPNTPFLHYAYGSALMFRARFDQAKKQLREETRITPDSALPYMRLAIVGLKTKQASKALPDAERAVQLAPDSATAHEIMGRVLSDLGKTNEAAKEAVSATNLKPEKAQASPAIARLYSFAPLPDRILSASPATDFEQIARQAKENGEAGQRDQAISLYQSALKQRPDWARGWSDLATLYYDAGSCARALPALKYAIAIDPKPPEPWVFLALCEFEQRDYRNSYIHLERGRELGYQGNAQEMTVAVTRLAELRNFNSDFYGATDLLVPEARRNRLTPEMKTVLGLALLRLPILRSQVSRADEPLVRAAGDTAALLYASRFDDAFHSFEQMLKSHPQAPFLHYAYASALETLSRYDEAQAHLRQELTITPRSPLSHMRLAAIALKLHRPEQALEAAQHAVEIDPGSAGGHELMGRALLELGTVDKAVKELETASALAPNYPEVHFNLARAYTRAKLTPQAERERALFTELNDAAEREKSSQAQAYGVPQAPPAPSGGVTKVVPDAGPQ
jgi:tetratricopeptide (TPR) repeat protein